MHKNTLLMKLNKYLLIKVESKSRQVLPDKVEVKGQDVTQYPL